MTFVVPFLLALFASVQEENPVRNGGFEEGLDGWTVTLGTEDYGHVADVTLQSAHSGKAALALMSPKRTEVQKTATQRVEARPGGRYKLVGWCKTLQLEKDMAAGQTAGLSLVFLDQFDRVLLEKSRNPKKPNADWHTVGVSAEAPERCRAVEIRIHSSMNGTMEVDDIALFISGGRTLPKVDTLLREDFRESDAIPKRWKKEIGATRSARGKASRALLDTETYSPSNPNSLCLDVDSSCKRWTMVSTTVDVEPGDMVTLTAMVKAENLRIEDDQYRNHHANLTFLDKKGQRLQFLAANCGFGSYNWKEIDLDAVAPPETARVRVGYFLSNTGKAWIDRIELVKTGNAGSAEAWPGVSTAHLDIRYAPDHPRAEIMKAYAARVLEPAYLSIRKKLKVQFEDRITVMLYRDGVQGGRMTGRRLNFAEPKKRIVHMRPNATPGHEMVHVIAEAVGQAGTALFGEGIAVWLDTQPSAFHHSRADALREAGELPSLDVLLRDFRSDEKLTYRAAGSFTGYLVTTYGMDTFKKLYVLKNPRTEAREHLGVHLDNAFQQWKAFLAAGKY